MLKTENSQSTKQSMQIESKHFPQADRLEKVFGMVELINDGRPKEDFHALFDVGKRQKNYYARGAESLGLIAEDRSNESLKTVYNITTYGRYLCQLSDFEKYQFMRHHFNFSPIGKCILDWANVTDWIKLTDQHFVSENVDRFFREYTKVNIEANTSERRLKSPEAWMKQIAEKLHLSFSLVR